MLIITHVELNNLELELERIIASKDRVEERM